MYNFQNPKVLLVEDDAIIALTESAFLEAEGNTRIYRRRWYCTLKNES